MNTPSRTRPALLVSAGVGLPVLLLALLVAGSYGPLLRLDDAASGAAERLGSAHLWVFTAARVATHLGDPLVMTAAAAVALAVVLVVLLPAHRARWLLLGSLVPLLVAVTRVLIGVHYPSDVVAGLLLGFGTTAVVTLVLGASRTPSMVRP